MHNCKPINTLVFRGEPLNLEMSPKTQEEKEKMSQVPYSSVVGSFKYDMMCTRLDICYAIGLVSRFQSNLGFAHWKVVKRILNTLRER